MKDKTRRNFLRSMATGLTGTALLPNLAYSNTNDLPQSSDDLWLASRKDASESYWKSVKKQFVFASGMTYFNNASLGACPIPVVKATNEFRATLDGFPSKYMWGGWDTEKEAIRIKVSEGLKITILATCRKCWAWGRRLIFIIRSAPKKFTTALLN